MALRSSRIHDECTPESLAVDLPQILRIHRGADITATTLHGASAAMILRRTWQSWLVLGACVLAWHLSRG